MSPMDVPRAIGGVLSDSLYWAMSLVARVKWVEDHMTIPRRRRR